MAQNVCFILLSLVIFMKLTGSKDQSREQKTRRIPDGMSEKCTYEKCLHVLIMEMFHIKVRMYLITNLSEENI